MSCANIGGMYVLLWKERKEERKKGKKKERKRGKIIVEFGSRDKSFQYIKSRNLEYG